MKVIEEYIENALAFEQLAAVEIDPTFKDEFGKQAVAFRELAAERTKRLSLGAPEPNRLGGKHSSPQYRVNLLDQDGHFIIGVILDCADDVAAIEAANKYADGYDIEVWDQSRKVATPPLGKLK